MYREQNYIFSCTFVYKQKMAWLVSNNKKKADKTPNLVFWIQKILHLYFFVLSVRTFPPTPLPTVLTFCHITVCLFVFLHRHTNGKWNKNLGVRCVGRTSSSGEIVFWGGGGAQSSGTVSLYMPHWKGVGLVLEVSDFLLTCLFYFKESSDCTPFLFIYILPT